MYCFWFILIFLFVNTMGNLQDGGKAPRIQLIDGNSIPAMGFGTFLSFKEKVVKENSMEMPVLWALRAGYRMVDTASVYKNEGQVAVAIRKSGIPRENLFIQTKLGSNEQRHVIDSLKGSLHRLNLTYVDMYLIHTPVTYKEDNSGYDNIDYLDTWKSMEQARKLGLTKSIGLSNFNISQIERILKYCDVKPAVLEVEVNLNFAQHKLVDFCKANGIVVVAYTPFGSLFDPNDIPPRINDPILLLLAKKYKKTTPQIYLKHLVQRGVVPIPKSAHKSRIEQNINIFDFTLTDKEMDMLSKFNINYRSVVPTSWQNHPYYPYERSNKTNPTNGLSEW